MAEESGNFHFGKEMTGGKITEVYKIMYKVKGVGRENFSLSPKILKVKVEADRQ